MANYGLRIRDASGNIVLNTDENLTRFRYFNEVAANVSDSIVLSDISGQNSVELSIALASDVAGCPHIVARSGTTFSWTANDPAFADAYSVASLVFMFLY